MGEGTNTKLHVVSCYAPTQVDRRRMLSFKILRAYGCNTSRIKVCNSWLLQCSCGIQGVCRKSVGVSERPNRYGVINDVGKQFLSFLSVHRATVCKTWIATKKQYTNRHGSILSPNSGVALTLSS